MNGEDFVGNIVGHKEELVKGAENQAIWFQSGKNYINYSKLFWIFESMLRPFNMQMQSY